MMNRQIVLRSRPEGNPTADNFEIVRVAVPPVTDGSVLRRTIYLSLDPYMRGRMSDAESYAASVAIRQMMVGHTVSQVVESHNPAFAAGDFVAGYDGWQEYGLSSGRELRKLDPAARRSRRRLGTLGMPGMTAYVGLLDIGQPRPARPWSCLPRQGQSAVWSDKSRGSRDVARLVSRDRRISATTWSMSWVLMSA